MTTPNTEINTNTNTTNNTNIIKKLSTKPLPKRIIFTKLSASIRNDDIAIHFRNYKRKKYNITFWIWFYGASIYLIDKIYTKSVLIPRKLLLFIWVAIPSYYYYKLDFINLNKIMVRAIITTSLFYGRIDNIVENFNISNMIIRRQSGLFGVSNVDENRV